jgi:hypothetical protein
MDPPKIAREDEGRSSANHAYLPIGLNVPLQWLQWPQIAANGSNKIGKSAEK